MASACVLTRIRGVSRSLFLKRLSAFGRERDAPWVNSVPEFDRTNISM